MSCGPVDMHREEEKKAAGMVEVCCAQCEHLDSENCTDCCFHGKFNPSKAALSSKVEELRNKTAIKKRNTRKGEGK